LLLGRKALHQGNQVEIRGLGGGFRARHARNLGPSVDFVKCIIAESSVNLLSPVALLRELLEMDEGC
jgi:hypothetical protein